MEISPGLGVAIMMNNYFHDVATAMLAASGFTLHAIVRIQAVMDSQEATMFFLRTHAKMVKFFRFALWWIVIGGIPRTVFYTSFEWANAADKLQVPALMVKHVLMFVLVVGGIIAWRRLKVKVAHLRSSLPAELLAALEH